MFVNHANGKCQMRTRSISLWLWCLIALMSFRLIAAPPESPPVDVVSGSPPGVIVAQSSDSQAHFMGSPSLVILPNRHYLASYDTGGQTPYAGYTIIVASTDRGESWEQVGAVPDQKWSTIFYHGDAVWLIGVTTEFGNMVIRRSDDVGRSWTTPTDGHSGLLAEGKFHCGPTPVTFHNGRIWRGFERFAPTGSPRSFFAFVISAPQDADLLDASVWTHSSEIQAKQQWLNTRQPQWFEGNVVVTPEGRLVNILRVESHPAIDAPFPLPRAASDIPRFEVAAMMDISADGREVTFDPDRGYIHFIGSEAKFTIRFDPESKRYWTIGSKITNPYTGYDWRLSPHHQRNVMSLCSSSDLRHWREDYRILRFREGQVVTKDESRVGFQYMDWVFDGNDIVAVCRLSWNGKNYHDANMITFHRIKNFRQLTMSDSPPPIKNEVP